MGNEQVSQIIFFLQLLQKVQYLRLNGHIQSGYRLVGNDQLGIHGKSPGDTDTLTLAAGKLMRITLSVGRAETDNLKKLMDFFQSFSRRHICMDKKGFPDKILNFHSGIQRSVGILKYHLDIGS